MTVKITGRASSNDDYANTSVARELVQRLGERVAHLLVEIHAACAAQCNHRNSIGYFCRQNISVHPVLLLFLMSLLHGRDRCEAIPINPLEAMIVRRPNRGSASRHSG